MRRLTHFLTAITMTVCLALAMALTPAAAKSKQEKATRLVERAAATVDYFSGDSAYEPLWSLADNAKAMVIVPRSLRGGFIFGASGGNAVMIARNDDGSWSQPTFFTIGSISFGFQAGGEASEIVLLVMTQRGMERLLSTTVKLGADLSLAAGPIGAGAKAQTADILAFSRSRGLYGGVSLEGALLKSRRKWNQAYYQADVTPADIIFREKVANPHAAQLQRSVWTLAHRNTPVTFAPVQPTGGDPAMLDPNAVQYGPDGAPLTGADAPETPVVFEDDAVYGAPLSSPDGQ
ncbi:MAG: lipid-binding SYLF domain-containing protein [Pseudomonadota bacterium]